MAEETTKISQTSEKELNDLLNMAGPDNVTTPVDTAPNNFFKKSADIKLALEKEETKVEEPKKETPKQETLVEESALKLGDEEEDIEETKSKSGDKVPIFDAFSDLVKDETILLFEDDKPLEEYSKKELIELMKANMDRVRQEEAQKVPGEFFDSLPPELQYAAQYINDGGKDIKGLLKHLSHSMEIKSLDITKEEDQEQAVRQWLSVSDFGTPEEIEAEIASYKDLGVLEKKAGQFKPKLDAKQQQIIDKELKEQEIRTKKQEEAAIKYRETVLKTIQPGTLNGIKITPSVQNMLFSGLTQAGYPSVSGKNTNLFGHLIEKYSYVEPNPALIAEALWLLNDPKAYRDAVKSLGNQEAVEDTVRKLKTAGTTKVTPTTDTIHAPATPTRKTIQKPKTNIFARQ